ncbi:MAG TPA: ribonuclease activity regulator RraA [Xanthobacteraceae bacterium]|nr:ribonuclease activity regulator RraA [Xanthobacteraceae bacterium]
MIASLDTDTITLLKSTNTATLTTIMYKRGLQHTFLRGVGPLRGNSYRFVAPAFTVRTVAVREDKLELDRKLDLENPHNSVQRQSVERCPPGYVMAIEARGNAFGAVGGAILYERMAIRGVAAVVTDGGCRDGFEIEHLGMPVYLSAVCPPPTYFAHRFVEMECPITIGECAIYPGDYLVGDPDGVVVVPHEMAPQVAREAADYDDMEDYVLKKIRAGAIVFGTYPLHGDELARYRQEKSVSK